MLIRQKIIKERSIIIWSSAIVLNKAFSNLARNYSERREEMIINRKVSYCTIKMISFLLHKLKKKGPDYHSRTVSLIK